jgi:hypothetical protein
MRTPKLGETVIYRQGDREYDAEPRGIRDTRLHPAIITRCWTPESVNLHVFMDGNTTQARTGVPMVPPDVDWNDDASGNSYWDFVENVPTEFLPDPTVEKTDAEGPLPDAPVDSIDDAAKAARGAVKAVKSDAKPTAGADPLTDGTAEAQNTTAAAGGTTPSPTTTANG